MPSAKEALKTLPQGNAPSWYPTQTETLDRQRVQLAEAKRQAHDFAKANGTSQRTRWWSKMFWRV